MQVYKTSRGEPRIRTPCIYAGPLSKPMYPRSHAISLSFRASPYSERYEAR